MGTFIDETYVRAGLEPTATPPATLINSLIARAEARLRVQVARLEERVDAGEVDREFVRSVLLDAILPIAHNPGGYVSETTGGTSYTWGARQTSEVRAQIVFSTEDIELLRPRVSAVRSASIGLPAWQGGAAR